MLRCVSRLLKYYAECLYAECRFAECRFAECRFAECRGAINDDDNLKIIGGKVGASNQNSLKQSKLIKLFYSYN